VEEACGSKEEASQGGPGLHAVDRVKLAEAVEEHHQMPKDLAHAQHRLDCAAQDEKEGVKQETGCAYAKAFQ
jgi:hypothetical protein